MQRSNLWLLFTYTEGIQWKMKNQISKWNNLYINWRRAIYIQNCVNWSRHPNWNTSVLMMFDITAFNINQSRRDFAWLASSHAIHASICITQVEKYHTLPPLEMATIRQIFTTWRISWPQRSRTVGVQWFWKYVFVHIVINSKGPFWLRLFFVCRKHENMWPCTESRVITSYTRIASCARTQFRSRASESQGNSATRYYAECHNLSAMTRLSKRTVQLALW